MIGVTALLLAVMVGACHRAPTVADRQPLFFMQLAGRVTAGTQFERDFPAHEAPELQWMVGNRSGADD